jgi:hypothetical protein
MKMGDRAMICRWLSHVFVLAGLVLFGLAGYFYFAPAPDPCLDVAEQAMELSGCIPGQKTPVVFHFQNHSSRPIRVLGLVTC